MKSKKLALSLNLIVVLALAFGLALPCFIVSPSTDTAYAATSMSSSAADWTQIYSGNYYDNINENATGASLRSQVAKLITDTHKTQTTYSGLVNAFKTADADPNKSGNIIWFYSGSSVSFSGFGGNSGATNREHVWPKDGGDAFPEQSGPGSDAHHLRPTETNLNSTRGSKSFDEVEQTTANIVKQNGSTNYPSLCYSNSTYFYPGKGYRGATARILFYLQTRWGDQYNLTFVDGAGKTKTIGKISTLLKWHIEEPPTDEEIRRNEAVFKLQGNRNPFIDHPEYATAIYCNDGQSYNNALKQVVAQYGDYNDDRPDIEGLTLNNTAFTLTAGQKQTLSVSVTPSNANSSVTWSSSNTSVATVSNGEVTAKSIGTATITATSVANPSIKATATVTVKGATAIELIGEPNKKIYEIGQNFDPTGLTVKLIYSDGSAETYSSPTDLARFSWTDAGTGHTALSANASKIKCKYGSIETISDWSITIKAATSIELLGEPAKTTYEVGERFDPMGLTVRIHYNDGNTVDYSSASELESFVWEDSVSGELLLDKSSSKIKCKYGDLSVVSSWTVTIKYVTGIELVGDPSTKVYQTGQKFNPLGVTVKILYSDNSYVNLSTASELSDVTWLDADTEHEILLQTTTKIKAIYGEYSQIGDWTIQVEVPPETIGDFVSSVVAIESAADLQARFNAIKAALTEYNKLSSADKAKEGAVGSYQILQQAISQYNADIAVHNATMESATKTGAYAIVSVTLAGVALLAVLNRKFY